MQSVTPIVVPDQALRALREWLRDNHYSQHANEAIVAFAAAEGTPTGSPYLDREDEGPASEVFCEAMPAVPSVSWQWDYGDMSGRWNDNEAVATRPVQHYAYEPGDDDRSIPAGAVLVPPELEDLAPIRGGGPDDEPEFTPSEADWEDYRGHYDRSEPLYGYE